MVINKKIDVLSKIAEQLNKENIIWAVGGSLLLYIKGKVTEFNDIDIMAAEEDVKRLKEILLTLGELQPPNPNVQYKTKYFLEFVIDQVEVDVMAGFVIVHGGKDYYFPLKVEDIKEYTTINAQRIPLQSLEQWKQYYELMGRTDKASML